MKKILLGLITVFLLCLPLQADQLTLTFVGTNTNQYIGDSSEAGIIGGYNVEVGDVVQQLWCDDFNTYMGGSWQANLAILQGNTFISGDPNTTKFLNQGITKYQELGWLMSQWGISPTFSNIVLQGAIWELFATNPSHPNIGVVNSTGVNLSSQVDAALQAAADNYGSFSGLLYIYTPVNFPDSQELVRVSPAPVPEPSSLILLGSGMIGLAGFARRQMKMKKG
jgi:hypothetical protein